MLFYLEPSARGRLRLRLRLRSLTGQPGPYPGTGNPVFWAGHVSVGCPGPWKAMAGWGGRWWGRFQLSGRGVSVPDSTLHRCRRGASSRGQFSSVAVMKTCERA